MGIVDKNNTQGRIALDKYISNLVKNSNFKHLLGTMAIGIIQQPVMIFLNFYKGIFKKWITPSFISA